MDSDFQIRLAREADFPHIPDIEQAAAQLFDVIGMAELFSEDPATPELLRGYLDDGRLWVAVNADDVPVGYARTSVVDGHAHLDQIDVLPAYGRRGIGTALVETVCAWAAAQGFPYITLSTQANVPWNMPFYAKLGFVVMPPETWSAAYHAMRQDEIDQGLPVADRVFMRRDFG